MKRQSFLALWVLIGMTVLLAACGGLAGEPEIVGQIPQQTAPISANLDIPTSDPDLALGAQIYATNCTRCHGILGAGDGEFAISGQIASIPDFTDPAQHQSRTAAEYYEAVTNGNLEMLMPPFSGSLTDEERWSVANYVLGLADGEAVVAVVDPETPETDEDPAPPVDNVHSSTTDVPELGTINGALLQGTTGASIPDSGIVTLTIVEMTGGQATIETELDEAGLYEFNDVPIIHDAGYFVSFDYGDGTFNSEFSSLTAASPIINLNIPIYETTDDPSVLQMEVVLAQVDLLNEDTLQMRQLISVVNTSDKLFVYTDNRGESVSVRVPAPQGVRLSPNIDLGRFVYNDNAVFDTRPVIPNSEHSFNLVYTVPFDGDVTIRQSFPYDFFGPYEAYVDSTLLRVNAEGWQTLTDPQILEGVTYRGIAQVGGIAADDTIEFRIQRVEALLSRQNLGGGVLIVGLALILVAGVFYWRAPQSPIAQAEADATSQALMQQIAALDDLFARGEIAEQTYKEQRDILKARLITLMKAEKST